MGDLSENFSRYEFECSCCEFNTVDFELLNILEDLRWHFNRPITITSGCRCPEQNKFVGGSEKSQHLYGRAADIVIQDCEPVIVANYAETLLGNSGGIGIYSGFVHLDTRTNGPARWEG